MVGWVPPLLVMPSSTERAYIYLYVCFYSQYIEVYCACNYISCVYVPLRPRRICAPTHMSLFCACPCRPKMNHLSKSNGNAQLVPPFPRNMAYQCVPRRHPMAAVSSPCPAPAVGRTSPSPACAESSWLGSFDANPQRSTAAEPALPKGGPQGCP